MMDSYPAQVDSQNVWRQELCSEVEAYIESAKSASGDSAVRYLNRAETALRSYDGVPERFKNTYFRLIEDIRNDLEQ